MTAEEKDRNDLEGEQLVSVHDVQDEAAAMLLCDFLKSQGIEATAVAVQIPWFGTIETQHHGYWGHIEVLGKDQERARELIRDYLAATPEPGEESS